MLIQSLGCSVKFMSSCQISSLTCLKSKEVVLIIQIYSFWNKFWNSLPVQIPANRPRASFSREVIPFWVLFCQQHLDDILSLLLIPSYATTTTTKTTTTYNKQ